MRSRSRYHRRPCRICRQLITNNALGRAAHMRSCTPEKAAAEAAKRREQAEKRALRLLKHDLES
jgi:hypothetical protein